MSFLAPLFLLGGLAVALPVIFHLVRRSSKEEMPFSSLMFLRPAPPRISKRSRLENLVLLVLRCLVLCLLALGFARPFFHRAAENQPTANAGRRMVLLVDTSASMQREGLWAAALARTREILGQAKPQDQVSVFTFDERSAAVMGFDEWAKAAAVNRAEVVADRLAQRKPGWAGTALGNALIAATEALGEAEKGGASTQPGRIVVISDLQEGSRREGLQGYEWPKRVEVQLEVVTSKRPTNAGLQWLVETDDSTPTNTAAGLRLRVSNSSQARREEFRVTMPELSGSNSHAVYVPPGQSRVVQLPPWPTNAAVSRIVLQGDEEPFDNTAYLVPVKGEAIRVLYLGNEGERDAAQPFYFLQRALQQTRRQDVRLEKYGTQTPLPPEVTGQARLIVAAEAMAAGQLGAVRGAVTNGATALIILKTPGMATSVGELLGAKLRLEEGKPKSYAMLGELDFSHPLFAAFADPRFSDFTKIHFWKYRRLQWEGEVKVQVLARFDTGDPGVVEMVLGKGRVILLASGWEPAESQLALSSKFVPLLYALLDLGGAARPPGVQYRVGEAVSLPRGPDPAGSIRVLKPDGSELELGPGQTVVRPEVPGVYTVAASQSAFQFAVNLDAAESRTGPLPLDELERLGVPLKLREPAQEPHTQEPKRRILDAELENQQKLWRWLTLAAMVLVLAETGVAGWLTGRMAPQAEGKL